MANPETIPGEPSPIKPIGKELIEFMGKAELGSARLLAFSDVLHERSLRNQIESLIAPVEKGDLNSQLIRESRLRIAEFGLALLRQQVENRQVGIKGYAADSFTIYELLSVLKRDCLKSVYQEEPNLTQEQAQTNAEINYFEITWGLYNTLTTNSED